ncbi:hypothetical protein EDB81DRAFT_860973 [Dactylonectria macrodidyma]|uniref:Major facilitator superfamily (MFS) profile domain-containing protein n=1 Tax=Dactylonectria macrodidyma TaxID=307937 RepID=A0A9P9DRS3_9HYPO|nr:hypothetical protein EDB81DRAFT_860973 [Dactylonectria macrodidyma]
MDSLKLEPWSAEQHKEGETRQVEVAPLDLNDPHGAALTNASGPAEIPSLSTLLAIASLALSFIAPISCGYVLVTGILVPIQTELGGRSDSITWLVGGWSVASSVSFSVAGALRDVFGRRWVIMSGQVVTNIGSIVGATVQTVDTVIAGSILLGFGCGVIFVSYAGISELLPNKWRVESHSTQSTQWIHSWIPLSTPLAKFQWIG